MPTPRASYRRVRCGCCGDWFVPTRWQRTALQASKRVYCSPPCRGEAMKRRKWVQRVIRPKGEAQRTTKQLPLFEEQQP